MPVDEDLQERLRNLPKIDALLDEPHCGLLVAQFGRPVVIESLREMLDEVRERLRNGALSKVPSAGAIIMGASRYVHARCEPSLRRVINATGIALHTNLGRAPLSEEAIAAVGQVASGYSNLEYSLPEGRRGSRQSHVESVLSRLTGAESALVVNNNAAAVMLAVHSVARDGEVVTSRGELIEIGGSFRIPDVIETSEAKLVEAGTTNRTRVQDFERAITPETKALLRVHPSNYRVVGFTESVSREELVSLARARGLAAIEDLGSGTLVDLSTYGLDREPTVQQAVAAGMDVVTFSGDKLLGGPQAGIAVGKVGVIARMKSNPLYRALRVDKMTLAALDATLRVYLNPESISRRIPVLRMIAQTPAELETRAKRVAKLFEECGCSASIRVVESYAGGGSLPEQALRDFGVFVQSDSLSADELHAELRTAVEPIVARVADGSVVLHMFAIDDADLELIKVALGCIVPP